MLEPIPGFDETTVALRGTGTVTADDYRTVLMPAIERAYNAVYPLHTGTLHNFFYKLYLSLVGAGVFCLSALGLVSFIKKYTASGV